MLKRQVQFIVMLLLFASHAAGFAAAIKVEAEAEGQQIYENTPVKVLVIISHSKNDIIDLSSFTAGGKPITAKLDNEKQMTATGDLVLSMFYIELPPQKQGLQIIPQVQVTISGKRYSAVPTTYAVLGSGATTTVGSTPAENLGSAFLRFEPVVDGPKTLYPGQKTILGYRYTFNINVNTTIEQIPLLAAAGLVKVGDKVVQQEQKQGISTITILQIVKGDKPGEYTYGPSKYEGIPYRTEPSGEIVKVSTPIISIAPPVIIKVVPFPPEGRPASFNGALGDFDWKASLLSSPKLTVGDELSLKIEVSGKGDWDSVNLPELCCQPGMSGLFKLNDLPPVGKLEDNVRSFVVQMRPLSSSIKEIPSLEFSSLDPDTSKYRVVHTDPIALTVEGLRSQPEQPSEKAAETSPGKEPWRQQLTAQPPLEIPRSPTLVGADLLNLPFGSWWVLFLIPFGIGLLIFQFNWITFLAKRKEEETARIEKSATLLKQAMEAPSGSALQHTFITQALLLRLVELGQLKSEDIDPHDLAPTGLQGEVRKFLLSIDEMRYAGQPQKSYDAIMEQAKTLYAKMEAV